jgi:hypothetical protein
MFAQDVQSQVGDLFTWAALGSLSVATAAAWMVPNVIGYLVGAKFDPYRKWVGFVSAMALSFALAAYAIDAGKGKWILAVLNGFLIFASGVGLNEVAKHDDRTVRSGAGGKRFFRTWFPAPATE